MEYRMPIGTKLPPKVARMKEGLQIWLWLTGALFVGLTAISLIDGSYRQGYLPLTVGIADGLSSAITSALVVGVVRWRERRRDT